MVVLGVDPGSLHTGYGVIRYDGAVFHLLGCGVIRLHRRKSYFERIGEIYRELESVIEGYEPVRLVLETVFLNKNVQSALKLGQVRGAVIALAMNHRLELSEYAPREVKAAVTGRGAASKQQVAFMVTRMLQITGNPATHDVTDALGIALCDLLKTGVGSAAVPLPAFSSGSAGKKNWAQFVQSNPGMVVR